MPCIQRQALVPFSPQAMFDLVAGVDRYPQFLPWCAESRILARREDGLDASLQLRFKGIKQSFSTRNFHQVPHRIRIELLDGPFERLEGAWQFEPLGVNALDTVDTRSDDEKGTKVSLVFDYQMKSGLLAKLFSLVFDIVAAQMMDAFLARAEQCYGGASRAVGGHSLDVAR